ncbi:MAG: M23 family metallopeptidase [Salinibacterium sp.]|nr:M23 family metallopeptidase [Salinibacterium sp.]
MIALGGVLAMTLCLAAASAQPALSNAQPAFSSAADSWTWPVEAPYRILRPFIAPSTPYSAGHRGIDVAVPSARVFAPSAGVVHFAGVVVDRPVLSIRHPGGVITSYEPVIAAVVEGQAVARGEVIGEVQPGHCSVLCVHFGVRRDGEYVSPLNYLGGIARSILLPTR